MPCQIGTPHEYIMLVETQHNTSPESAFVDCHSQSDNTNFEYRRRNIRIDGTLNNTSRAFQCVPKRKIYLVQKKIMPNV